MCNFETFEDYLKACIYIPSPCTEEDIKKMNESAQMIRWSPEEPKCYISKSLLKRLEEWPDA